MTGRRSSLGLLVLFPTLALAGEPTSPHRVADPAQLDPVPRSESIPVQQGVPGLRPAERDALATRLAQDAAALATFRSAAAASPEYAALLPAIERAEAARQQAEVALSSGRPRAEVRHALAALDEALRVVRAGHETARSTQRERLQRPTALVVSGGVSLGAHQAGFLHFYTEFLHAYADYLRQARPTYEAEGVRGFEVATGASAGSINAFLALVAGCREPVPRPEDSTFFRTWIPVGMERLFDPREVKPNALLSREPITDAVTRIERLWSEPSGWRAGSACSGMLGMSVTPLKRRVIERQLASSGTGPKLPPMRILKASEKFMFRMEPGPDGRPVFRPLRPPPELGVFYPRLWAEADDRPLTVDDIVPLLVTSSSFPIAFEPVTLDYAVEGGGPRERLTAPFIDGGVFDNTPLRLAIHMQAWSAQGKPRDTPWILFVEPDAVAWRPGGATAALQAPGTAGSPGTGPGKAKRAEPGFFEVYLPFLSSFIASSRQAELAETFESEPTLGDRLVMPARNLPVASSQLGAFLGFFERDFRVFDFYVGMTDALKHLREHSDQYAEMVLDGREVAVQSEEFACLRAVALAPTPISAGAVRSLPACRSLDVEAPARCGRIRESGEGDPVCPRNFLALLEASLELRQGIVDGVVGSEQETDTFFALLDHHGYRFRTIEASSGDEALDEIRATMQRAIQRLGAKQRGFLKEQAVWVGGKAAANAWRYRPARQHWWLGFESDRGLELGYAHKLWWRYLRLNGALRLFQFDKLNLGGDDGSVYALSVMPSLTLSVEAPVLPWLQVEPALGWSLMLREGVSPFTHLMYRHGPEASLTAVLLQRAYLQVGVTQYVDDCASNNRCGEVAERWRSSPNDVTTHVRDFRVSVGWRSLLDW